MRTSASPTRTGLTASGLATAIMAVMAVAATAGAVPSPVLAAECRSAVIEGQPARVVAAVVAAVARDLLGLDSGDECAWCEVAAIGEAPAAQRPTACLPPHSELAPAPPLRDALLDLPPPTC